MKRHFSAFPLVTLAVALLAVIPVDASEDILGSGDSTRKQAGGTVLWEALPISDEMTNAGCSVAIDAVDYGGVPLLIAHVGGKGSALSTTDESVHAYLSAMGNPWQPIPGTTTSTGSADWACPGLDSEGGYTAAAISWDGDVAVAIFGNDPYRDLVGFLTPFGQTYYSRNVAVDDRGRVLVATEDGEGFVAHENNGDGTWGLTGVHIPASSPQGSADQELRLAASDGVVAATRIGNRIWFVELRLNTVEGYVFEELTLPEDVSTNRFGYAVDTDSGVVVVGAPDDPSDDGNTGSVYVFQRTGSSWDVVQLRPSREANYRAFGSSVTVSDGRIVVGAPGPATSLNDGGVFLFDFDGASWHEVVIDLPDGVAGDGRLGAAVDLAGDTLLVGQPGWSQVHSVQLPDRGSFIDDDLSIFEADIEWLVAEGITKGCNPPINDMFCPDAAVTRGQMAAFLVRALDLTDDGGGNTFIDDDGSIFETDIAKLAAAGITKGCNPPVNDRFCPGMPVTRGQMAAFLVRALDLTDDGGGNSFVDDDGSVFEVDIAKLATAGITRGCNPPVNDEFCPGKSVTRGQMAAFLHRALGG